MNTEQQATPTKKKGGRPKAEKHGTNIWVAAEYVTLVNEYLEFLKGIKTQRQAKQ